MVFHAAHIALYAQMAIGITFLPFWLKAQGLNEATIGMCMAPAAIIAVVVNPLVGTFADRTRRNKATLVGRIIGATCATIALTTVSGAGLVVAAYLIYRALVSPLVPMAESILIANLAAFGLDFGRVCASGSASVVTMALLCGSLVDWFDPSVIVWLLLVVMITQLATSSGQPSRARCPARDDMRRHLAGLAQPRLSQIALAARRSLGRATASFTPTAHFAGWRPGTQPQPSVFPAASASVSKSRHSYPADASPPGYRQEGSS